MALILLTTRLLYRNNWLTSFCFIYLYLILPLASATDNISTVNSLSGDETLLSPGGNFELGFFKPGNSTNYYIGIWYSGLARQTIVWVANRDNPIADKYSSELKIVDGNLVLLSESNDLAWSTNVSLTTMPNSVVALLLDDGNLVLRDGSRPNGQPIWQSFDFPTNTFLPGSKIGYSKVKNAGQSLTSWKNPNDPGTGLFSVELDPDKNQFLIIWNRSTQYWTSGSWDGEKFSLMPEMRLNYIFNFSYVSNENESYFTYSIYNRSILSRLVLDVSGQIKQLSWLEDSREWSLFWTQPRVNCDVYGVCGAFSVCNALSLPYCQCLTGFSPMPDYDWNSGDYSSGCVRETNFKCGDTRGAKQSFFKSPQLKLSQPSQQLTVGTPGECETICLNNCSCSAYAYTTEMCEIWNNELMNIQQSEDNGTSNTVYIKLASSNLQTGKGKKGQERKLIGISLSVAIFVVTLSCIVGYVYKRMARRQESKRTNQGISLLHVSENDKEVIDVPLFDFEIIRAATDDFSYANKLGQGGFGPVYKGKLPGGREVAVKRLSSHSGQGLEEFKNEVVLIAKLQHRNLVKILGYCIKGDEKILVYEYMPNKSLDTFIFDLKYCKLLDWPKRFDVILGIARGLLYLHQDSRLRIIHRDMKTSNILLDEEMTPKISDFGLARIVGGRETEASTNRVVGTYGYMSPEYAFHGHFSVKSDVFSFGVVMLEIISGKRNTGFSHSEHDLSLLGYAWQLWKEEKPLDLMDQMLVESYDSSEILKCIIVGLLCVQEDPGDRPTMMNVVLVLSSESSEIRSLPNPKQPAFVARKHLPVSHSSSSKWKSESDNHLTVTLEEGR